MKKILGYLKQNAHNVLFQAFVPLAPINSQSGKLAGLYGSQDLAGFINNLFVFALSMGAIFAVVRLMWAGYLYMGSGDMWSSKGEAKKVLGDVVFGLVLLLGIYLILFQINPDMLKLNILDKIKTNRQTPIPTQPIPSEQFAPDTSG